MPKLGDSLVGALLPPSGLWSLCMSTVSRLGRGQVKPRHSLDRSIQGVWSSRRGQREKIARYQQDRRIIVCSLKEFQSLRSWWWRSTREDNTKEVAMVVCSWKRLKKDIKAEGQGVQGQFVARAIYINPLRDECPCVSVQVLVIHIFYLPHFPIQCQQNVGWIDLSVEEKQ